MFSRLKNLFKKKKTATISTPTVAGRPIRPVYTVPSVPTPTPTTTVNRNDDGHDFLSGYVTASIINDLLDSSASKVSESAERSASSEKSTWNDDYGSSKSESSSSDSWSSSSSSSDSWSSSSSSSDSWSSSDSSSSGSDW